MYIIESKTKELIEKHRRHWDEFFESEMEFNAGEYQIDNYDTLIKHFNENNPVGNNKYLKFYLENSDFPEIANDVSGPVDIMNLIRRFDAVLPYLKNKDIYSKEYTLENSFGDNEGILNPLLDAIIDAEKIKKDKQAEKEAIKIYEDQKYLVVAPQSYESSCKYGAGTKWCTTAHDGNGKTHFSDYTRNGALIYIIDKTVKTTRPYYKIAILYRYNEMHFYDDEDNRMRNMLHLLPDTVSQAVNKYIDSYGKPIFQGLAELIHTNLNSSFITNAKSVSTELIDNGKALVINIGFDDIPITKLLILFNQSNDKIEIYDVSPSAASLLIHQFNNSDAYIAEPSRRYKDFITNELSPKINTYISNKRKLNSHRRQ